MVTECSLVNVPLDWDNLQSWVDTVLQGKGLRATLGRLCLGNDLLHLNTPRLEESMLVQIKWEVRSRLLAG
jgi:hypothetical protein